MAVLRINLDWGSPWNPIVVAPWVAASRKVKMDLTPSLKHEYPVASKFIWYTCVFLQACQQPVEGSKGNKDEFCCWFIKKPRVILPSEFLLSRFAGVFSASSYISRDESIVVALV
ncbi:hypothetical protein HZH66_002189 [Vespula vulgaris]|uniref:Uncharacterized protein n=1 Tax=Vespula vulgaris TaxID=7454 RepID=A0A834KKM5_VESVU|nr:hypothetical protein HZH66_002189 [Vespula vulgaris]